MEAFNVKPDPAAVEFAWPHLNSPDRFIRYAARLAIERNPVAEWQAKALAEKQPEAALTALLALARLGAADTQPAVLKSLISIPFANLTEEQKLEKLRVIEVSIARHGIPTGEIAKQLIADVDPLYPAKTEFANRELCQILLALNAPNAVARTVALLKAAPTQEEQVSLRDGFAQHQNGLERRSAQNVSLVVERRPFDRASGAGRPMVRRTRASPTTTALALPISCRVLTKRQNSRCRPTRSPPSAMFCRRTAASQQQKPSTSLASRKLVKAWTTADLQPLLDQVGKGRNFARGKEIFTEAQCIACHRYGDQGGAIGPDLTAVAARFKRQDILESITEPSKVVSEQYMNTAIETDDGRVFVGRIVKKPPTKSSLRPNPLEPATVTVENRQIESRKLSKISPMPEGLLNTFNKDEILDLLAFLESLSDPDIQTSGGIRLTS